MDEPTQAPSVSQPEEKKVVEEKKADAPVSADPDHLSVTDMWGDMRYSPGFLRVAEWFGIDEKEYMYAGSKITKIIEWAAKETGSKNFSDIINKISETSRTLQSPGYGEKRYAILYRYIKLAAQKQDIDKEMDAYTKKPEPIVDSRE